MQQQRLTRIINWPLWRCAACVPMGQIRALYLNSCVCVCALADELPASILGADSSPSHCSVGDDLHKRVAAPTSQSSCPTSRSQATSGKSENWAASWKRPNEGAMLQPTAAQPIKWRRREQRPRAKKTINSLWTRATTLASTATSQCAGRKEGTDMHIYTQQAGGHLLNIVIMLMKLLRANCTADRLQTERAGGLCALAPIARPKEQRRSAEEQVIVIVACSLC